MNSRYALGEPRESGSNFSSLGSETLDVGWTGLSPAFEPEAPVIFSHSTARRLCDHERNIWDDQIQRCAARGGLVGVTGVSLFLGPKGADPTHVVEHVDYICQLAGSKHVGLGLDAVLLRNSESKLDLSTMGEIALKFWPARQYPAGLIGFVPPEALPAIVDGLLARGYRADDVRAILGGNFMRLAGEVWKRVA